jgi:hypothetical protein
VKEYIALTNRARILLENGPRGERNAEDVNWIIIQRLGYEVPVLVEQSARKVMPFKYDR